MALYSSSLPSFPSQTNKVDLADAVLINTMNAEIVAIATALGTNPQESRATLKARLNSLMDADGSIVSSNGFPDGVTVPSYPSQLWYKTDTDVLYIRNTANSAWNQVGASQSQYAFAYEGIIETCPLVKGEILPTGLWATPPTVQTYKYLAHQSAGSGAYGTVWLGQWRKLSGVTAIDLYTRHWSTAGGTTRDSAVRISIGTAKGSTYSAGSACLTSPYPCLAGTIDVSGLTNGSMYDVIAETTSWYAGGVSVYVGSIFAYAR